MNFLTDYLCYIGYADLCSAFFPGSPCPDVWKNKRQNITNPTLLRFYRLLLINEAVASDEFTSEELALLTPFFQKDVLTRKRGHLQSSGFSLFMVLGNWLLFETPNVNPKVYYGDDSFALLTRLRPMADGTTLDLCAGPGAQSIYCASRAASVVSVEINPVSAGIAEINQELNQLSSRWQIRVGDLYEALDVDNHQFDHIVCNPPLLPFPESIQYPFVGHGGSDGWAVTWRVLDGLPRYLKEGGLAQIIGTTLSDGVEPIVMERLQTWARNSRMDCQLTIISQNSLHQGSLFFERLIYSASVMNLGNTEALVTEYSRFLDANNMTKLVSHTLSVCHGKGKVSLIDLFDKKDKRGLWYIL